jgi:leucyl aminopeptidase
VTGNLQASNTLWPSGGRGPLHVASTFNRIVLRQVSLPVAGAGARLKVVEGDALLDDNWPAVHTVGRAAARPPVVLDITWQPSSSSSSSEELPLVALVGKGVCFDSGGRLR